MPKTSGTITYIPPVERSKKERSNIEVLPPNIVGEEGIDFIFDKEKRKIKVISVHKEKIKPENKGVSVLKFNEKLKSLRGIKTKEKINDEE